jgi:hypothetical protein
MTLRGAAATPEEAKTEALVRDQTRIAAYSVRNAPVTSANPVVVWKRAD